MGRIKTGTILSRIGGMSRNNLKYLKKKKGDRVAPLETFMSQFLPGTCPLTACDALEFILLDIRTVHIFGYGLARLRNPRTQRWSLVQEIGKVMRYLNPRCICLNDDITVFALVGIIAVMLWTDGQDRVISPVLL